MNERLKELRYNLRMTQQAFADSLNIPRNNIAGYETGKRSPSDAVISLICKEFDVNEDWLRNGTGDMFIEKSRSEVIAEFAGKLMKDEEDSFRRRLIEALASLDESEWEVLAGIAEKIVKNKDQT